MIDGIAGIDPSQGRVLWRRVLDSYDQGCILAPIVSGEEIFTSTWASRTGHYLLTYRDKPFTISDGWKNKLVLNMSSPLVIGDVAYAHLKNGSLTCIDLRGEKINWISNRRIRYESVRTEYLKSILSSGHDDSSQCRS